MLLFVGGGRCLCFGENNTKVVMVMIMRMMRAVSGPRVNQPIRLRGASRDKKQPGRKRRQGEPCCRREMNMDRTVDGWMDGKKGWA